MPNTCQFQSIASRLHLRVECVGEFGHDVQRTGDEWQACVYNRYVRSE